MAVHCPHCGWTFGGQERLDAHLGTHHSGVGEVAGGSTEPSPPPAATAPSGNASPGWYPNPTGEGERYWDGTEWKPWTQWSDPEPSVGGWRLALSYLAAFLLPVIGFFAGIYLLVKRSIGHGIAVMGIAVASMLLVVVMDPVTDSNSGGGGSGRSVEESVSRIEQKASDKVNDCLDHHHLAHVNRCLGLGNERDVLKPAGLRQ